MLLLSSVKIYLLAYTLNHCIHPSKISNNVCGILLFLIFGTEEFGENIQSTVSSDGVYNKIFN